MIILQKYTNTTNHGNRSKKTKEANVENKDSQKKKFAFVRFDGEKVKQYGIDVVIGKYKAIDKKEVCEMIVKDKNALEHLVTAFCEAYEDDNVIDIFGHEIDASMDYDDIVNYLMENANAKKFLKYINKSWKEKDIMAFNIVDTQESWYKVNKKKNKMSL